MDFTALKKRAALLSIGSNSLLIVSKFSVGIISGSVSIISEAVHSLSDLLTAVIAYFSVKIASEPADSEHQFGHDKFEDLSGGIEGALIIIAAAYIIYEAVMKIINQEMEHIDTNLGILVMLVSIIVNILVSSHLLKVAKKTDSLAILADAQHLRTDVYTSVGVLFGLILIKFTGNNVFDPVVAIVIAIFIIKAGTDLCMTSLKNLLDTSLPEAERKIIDVIIQKYMSNEVVDFQSLKTRKAGAKKLIEFTLIVPENLTIKEGHDLCDRIEEDLNQNIGNTETTIHLEPCGEDCPKCLLYHKNSQTCQKVSLKS